MTPASQQSEIDEALTLIRKEVCEGVCHGFFELKIEGEIVKGGKRQITVRAGKSHRFVIN